MKLKSANVLIIDDDHDTLAFLKISLERKNYVVLAASSWEEVAERIEITYTKKTPIDVVILDIMMPGRSGFDILRSLQVVLIPTPPVIILSAITGIDQQLKAREIGAAVYLTKPTTLAKLVDSIEKVLNT